MRTVCFWLLEDHKQPIRQRPNCGDAQDLALLGVFPILKRGSDGDLLVVIESMKMENEIMAHRAGAIASLEVGEGDSVEADQVIATLE